MTSNQIKFAQHKEDVRHNLVSERQKVRDQEIGLITAEAARSQAATAAARQKEDYRHNIQTENINWWSTQNQLAETNRHNTESERVAWGQLAADTSYKQSTAKSQARQATVAERNASVNESALQVQRYNANTARMNVGVGYAQAAASQLGAEAAKLNADTRQSELAETIRINSLRQDETVRHNEVQESISSQEADSRALQASAAVTNANANALLAEIALQRAPADTFSSFARGFGSIVGGLGSTIGGMSK